MLILPSVHVGSPVVGLVSDPRSAQYSAARASAVPGSSPTMLDVRVVVRVLGDEALVGAADDAERDQVEVGLTWRGVGQRLPGADVVERQPPPS